MAQSQDFRNSMKELKKTIYRTKKTKRVELAWDVNNDPWSLSYRIVMRKLEKATARPGLEPIRMQSIMDDLFSAHPERAQQSDTEFLVNIPLFNEDELLRAADSRQSKKHRNTSRGD